MYGGLLLAAFSVWGSEHLKLAGIDKKLTPRRAFSYQSPWSKEMNAFIPAMILENTVYYAMFHPANYSEVGGTGLSTALNMAPIALTVLFWATLMVLFNRDPSMHSTEVKGELPEYCFCTKCERYQAGRHRWHCSKCHRCVEEFDHHCPWINQCVGKENYRLWLVWLTSFFVTMAVHVVVAVVVVYDVYTGGSIPASDYLGHELFLGTGSIYLIVTIAAFYGILHVFCYSAMVLYTRLSTGRMYGMISWLGIPYADDEDMGIVEEALFVWVNLALEADEGSGAAEGGEFDEIVRSHTQGHNAHNLLRMDIQQTMRLAGQRMVANYRTNLTT